MPITPFRTALAAEGTTVTATFQGNAESDNFEELAEFMRVLDAEVTRTSASCVVADLRELEFATSSCLKVFATWLIEIEERAVPYRVEFLANNNHSWQRRSLRALAACAPAVMQIKPS
jgi:hypothetical protein